MGTERQMHPPAYAAVPRGAAASLLPRIGRDLRRSAAAVSSLPLPAPKARTAACRARKHGTRGNGESAVVPALPPSPRSRRRSGTAFS